MDPLGLGGSSIRKFKRQSGRRSSRQGGRRGDQVDAGQVDPAGSLTSW
jgi:hypothetical protein